MTVPVSRLVANASKILQDIGSVRWSQADLIDWGSEGQVALMPIKPDAYTRTVEHQLVSGAKQTLPEDSLALIDVSRNVDGTAVTQCDRHTLDRFSPSWTTKVTSSTVEHWMPDPQPDTFYVYPPQGATPGRVVLTHAAIPPRLEASGNLRVRDVYEPNITNYMIYRALSEDAEFAGSAERAVAYYKLFTG